MRRALNDNPVAQIAVLAVLAVVVGFLLLTRVANKSDGGEPSDHLGDGLRPAAPAPAIDSASSTASDSATGSG